jgi:hypothetical protein
MEDGSIHWVEAGSKPVREWVRVVGPGRPAAGRTVSYRTQMTARTILASSHLNHNIPIFINISGAQRSWPIGVYMRSAYDPNWGNFALRPGDSIRIYYVLQAGSPATTAATLE